MALTQQQIDWIRNAAGAVPQIDAAINIEEIKAKKLKAARETIDKNVGTIAMGENFKVEVLSDFLKMKVEMSSISDDPNEEFDTGHDTKKMTEGLDKDSVTKLLHAQSIIANVTADLRKANDPVKNKPLFTDKEISDAIWQPLKRQKLIPENAIPDRYSDVSTTFTGASGEYEARLQSFTDSLKGNEGTLKALGLTKEVIETLGSVANGVVAGVGAFGDIQNIYGAETIIKGVTSVIGSSMTISQTMVKDGGITKQNCDAIAKEFFKAASDSINAVFGMGSREGGYDFGKMIAYAVGAGASGPSIYVKIQKKEYSAILDDVADLIIAGGNAFDYQVKSTGATDKTDTGMHYNEVGMAIGNSLKTFRSLFDAFKDGNPTPEQLLKVLQTAIKGAVDTVSYVAYDAGKSTQETKAELKDGLGEANDPTVVDKDKLEVVETTVNPQGVEDLNIVWGVNELEMQKLRDDGAKSPGLTVMDKLYKEASKGPEALAKAIKDDPSLKAMEKVAAILEKKNKEIQEQALKTFDQEMQESDRQFRDMLNRSETGDSEKDVETLEMLVVEMKKDQMVIDLALQITSAGGGAVSAMAGFFPQLGAVTYSIELVKNIYKASQHIKAYLEWQENVRDARSAMSVQVEAMTNRMDWSGKKTGDEVLAMLENAAKIVGSVMSYAGPFAPVGHAVAAGAGAVTSIRNLITKMVREAEMKDAWKIYKSARSNPDDRKLVRESMRKNPTLAKYVIAWGAVVEEDAVAKAAMKKCGLTEEVLGNKNSSVQKVVTFLESLYPDDPVLLEPTERAKWYPGKVEYTGASFATFVGAAETTATPKLKKGAAASLIKEFTRFDVYKDAAAKAQAEWQKKAAEAQKDPLPQGAKEAEQEAEDAWRVALDAALNSSRLVLNAVKSFKPMAEDGATPHKKFAAYCQALIPTGIAFVNKFKREREGLGIEAEE